MSSGLSQGVPKVVCFRGILHLYSCEEFNTCRASTAADSIIQEWTLGMSKKQPIFETGDVPKVGYFRNIPDEFKIKSLYSNDLILNIASKSKEAVQKLKFLDSPFACEFLLTQKHRCCVEKPPSVAVLKSLLEIDGVDTRS